MNKVFLIIISPIWQNDVHLKDWLTWVKLYCLEKTIKGHMVSQTQQFEIQRAPNPPSLPNTAFFFIRNILAMLF